MGCTTYREENDASKAETKKMAELSLKRYLFYFERFNNHRQSLGFEQDLRTNVKEKAEQLQICSNLCHVDTLFLLEAVDDLCRCRQTLMYTYIFAYFLKEDNNAEIFIENQKDLQRAVEELSGFLERDITEITTENMSQTKRRVIDLAVYCRGRRDTLVSHIKEGYDHNSWQYIDFSPQM
jgi:ariadne-1